VASYGGKTQNAGLPQARSATTPWWPWGGVCLRRRHCCQCFLPGNGAPKQETSLIQCDVGHTAGLSGHPAPRPALVPPRDARTRLPVPPMPGPGHQCHLHPLRLPPAAGCVIGYPGTAHLTGRRLTGSRWQRMPSLAADGGFAPPGPALSLILKDPGCWDLQHPSGSRNRSSRRAERCRLRSPRYRRMPVCIRREKPGRPWTP
jgi:hypothetical protein